MLRYADGDEPHNEGYVSITFEYDETALTEALLRSLASYQFTVSVVDAKGESRFPQSFQIDGEERDVTTLDHPPIKLERFIKRRVLLDSSEEFLPYDTLTLRFEVVYSLDDNTQAEDDLRRLRQVAKEESWFIREEVSDDGYYLFDLRNLDSPLCTRLREKSKFFECLFQMPSKTEKDEHLPIEETQFDDFFNMLGYIRFGDLQHAQFDGQYCDLYSMANKYEVVELQEVCSEYLQQHLTWELAMTVLWVADACYDVDLGAAAFGLALDNWKEVRNDYWELIEDLNSCLPMAIRELMCAVKILNLEDGFGETLSDLAARQVLLNRGELQRSPTWSAFTKEMPGLAKVILSWHDKYHEAERYQDHAVCFDFYK